MASVNVSVQSGNSLIANVETTSQVINLNSTSITASITPTPNQVISLDRGFVGPPGPNAIGGYPISVSTPSNYDALMFLDNEWTNVPQVEITDGGNY
jgi:hypothetical protein